MRRFILAGCLMALAFPAFAERAEVHDGRFYVNGRPFYVVGVGYAPWRPHQRPGSNYVGMNYHWTEDDFQRIKAAHFNTIRTWDALSPEELELARKYGLMVIQSIRLDPRQNFSDPRNQESALQQIQRVAEQSKDADNILGYLLMTEPSPSAVLESGAQNTLVFFRRLKRALQQIDPRPVSVDSWLPDVFLDYSDFDFVTFNLYPFSPDAITQSLGYANSVRWLTDRFAPERPFLIGETGGYSVSKATWSAAGGYGGLTEYDQSLKDLQSLRDAIQGHAAGSVLVSWIDTWFFPKDADTHDNEPWEWNGLLAIETDSKKDMRGVPRQVYRDVARFNEALVIEPKVDHVYNVGLKLPIDVYAADNVAAVRYSLNGGDWQPLNGPAQGWWHGFFQLPKLAKKRQHFAIQALDADDAVLETKNISFVTGVMPEQVTLDYKPPANSTATLTFQVEVRDGRHQPIARRKIYYGFFYPVSGRQSAGTAATDFGGRVTIHCPLAALASDRYILAAVGTDSPEHIRAGDMRLFKLGS